MSWTSLFLEPGFVECIAQIALQTDACNFVCVDHVFQYASLSGPHGITDILAACYSFGRHFAIQF